MSVEVMVLSASLAMQLVAVGLALRLIRRTSSALGWTLIVGAIALMGSRRAVTLVSVISGATPKMSLTPELIALAISILMVAGVALIGSTFQRLQTAERLVRDRERDVREMLNGTPDGLLLAHDRTWIYANPTATRLLGLDTHDERDISEIVGAANRKALVDGPFRADAEQGTAVDLTLERTPPVTVELVAGPFIEHEGARARLFVVRDLSDRKAMEESLLQAQKLEALGRMAGGIAHDINNMLTVILASTELAKSASRSQRPIKDSLDAILEASDRARALTSQLLAFSRHGASKLEVIDLDALVSSARSLLQTLLGDMIQLELRTSPGLHTVEADASQLEQIVVNLAANARDAMPEGGRVTIATRNATIDGRASAPWAGARSGSYVVLAVSDTGSGIDLAAKAKIFDPFFTTKAKGKGSGLGLATCFAIARRMSGGITVDSTLGVGSTFEVWLPASAAPARPIRSETPRALSPGAAARLVVVVDDDAKVRAVSARALREAGFEVEEADGGAQAIAVLDSNPDVAAVFSDVVMPGMSGIELADEIRKRRPGIPVLLASGYAEEIERRPDLDFLAKPYRVGELVERLQTAITKARKASAAS